MMRYICMNELNCVCCMVDRRIAFSLISSLDHCQRFSPSWISDTPRAGFELAQNLSSGLVEWSFAVVTATITRRHHNHYTKVPSLQKKMSNNNFISEIFFKNPAMFRFVQKPLTDCTLTKIVKTMTKANQSNATK